MERTTLNELARMRKLAGINESFGGVDADDGAQIMGRAGLSPEEAARDAADVAASQGAPAPTPEEIALKVAEFVKAFEFLKANGQIKPEYLSPLGEAEDLDEGIESNIKLAKKVFLSTAKWLGIYILAIQPIASAIGFETPDLSHVTHDIFQMANPDGQSGWSGDF
jgi:hypothetical protein